MSATPIWQIDVQKRLGNEYWTNVYHTLASDQVTAEGIADAIVTLEQNLHMSVVVFVSYRVSPYPGPSEGTVRPIGLLGLLPTVSYLPLWNVVRVDFPAPTGRPSRKYYRLPIAEAGQSDGVLETDTWGGYQNKFDVFFATTVPGGLCDVDGQPLHSATVMRSVGMRQLRRGSKRRLEPVIPVA